MIRWLMYSRVSTEEQDTKTQIKLCHALIESRGGGEILFFEDPLMSSGVPMQYRKGLQAMLDEIREGDVVVVYDTDRLGRDVVEIATIYKLIKQLGAEITSHTAPVIDEFLMNIKASFSQEERKRIRDRTKDKLSEKQSRLERVGAAWFGYTVDPNHLSPYVKKRSEGKPYLLIKHPQEYPALLRMLELEQQGHSFGEMAKVLASEGHTNRQGNPIQKMSIYRILLRKERYNLDPDHLKCWTSHQSKQPCAV